MLRSNSVPLVLIQCNTPGSAFIYRRYLGGEMTDAVEFDPAPVGKELETLSRSDVELFRKEPKKLC